MAPAAAPKYVVSVVIQNPQGMHFGGEIAAPVFKKVMSFVLQSKQVQPIASAAKAYPLTQAALFKSQRNPFSKVAAVSVVKP